MSEKVCPKCGQAQGVLWDAVGSVISCPHCKATEQNERAENERKTIKDQLDKELLKTAQRAPVKDAIDLSTKVVGTTIAAGMLWNVMHDRSGKGSVADPPTDGSAARHGVGDGTFTRANIEQVFKFLGLKCNKIEGREYWELSMGRIVICPRMIQVEPGIGDVLREKDIRAITTGLGISMPELRQLLAGYITTRGFLLIYATELLSRVRASIREDDPNKSSLNNEAYSAIRSARIIASTGIVSPSTTVLEKYDYEALEQRREVFKERPEHNSDVRDLAKLIRDQFRRK